ncbi:MAG: hypothetical protein N3A66_10510, partial [Planctomycetota bacterium]|nr:hypothetical protein [Planctomycetota bacterium]
LPAILADVLRQARAHQRTNGYAAALAPHAAMRGLSLVAMPPVARYIAVGPPRRRGGATALITAAGGEPLAAAWRVGLGRVAFLAGAPWRDWGWESQGIAAQLVHNLMAWCLGRSAAQAEGEMSVRREGGRVYIEFIPPLGAAPTAAVAQWEEIMPLPARPGAAGAGGEIPLLPVKSRLWQAEANLDLAEGIYRFEAVAKGEPAPLAAAPLLVEERAEWLRLGPDGAALARIAAAGGGEMLSSGSAIPGWDDVPISGSAPEPRGALYLLGIGLALFLLGLAAAGWR